MRVREILREKRESFDFVQFKGKREFELHDNNNNNNNNQYKSYYALLKVEALQTRPAKTVG